MNTINKILIVFACVTSPMSRAVDIPSASELLDRYTATQDKLSSFISKTEIVGNAKWTNEDRPIFTREVVETRIDGERIHIHKQSWFDLPSKDAPTPIEDAKIFYILWDGNRNMIYRVGLRADMDRNEESMKQGMGVRSRGLPFFGMRFSDNEPLHIVLQKSKAISVRDKLERVGSQDCYVIDAKTSSGTYTIWLDPKHGYQVAQAEIRVGPGDHFRVRTLGDKQSRFLSIRNIRYEKIDETWIPMEADIHFESIGPEPYDNSISDSHHKMTQINLNPDHEALGSFVPALANGTPVIDRDFGIKYTWQDGKLVPDVDEYAVDQIRGMAREMRDQNDVPPGLIPTGRTEVFPRDLTADANRPLRVQSGLNEVGHGIQAQSRSLTFPILIVAVVLIIVFAGVIVLRRSKIREK